MTELEVRNILGKPEYNILTRLDGNGMGIFPDIPWNMSYKYYNYFIHDQVIIIYFISKSDYSNLTGRIVEDNNWRVIEKYMESASITS